MRLNHLYTSKSSRTLMEESSQPLDPARLHPIQRSRVTQNLPRIQWKNRLATLDRLSRRDPASAYRQLRDLVDRDVTTGLQGRARYQEVMGEASDEVNDNGLKDYIVISADVDNVAHMNEKSGLGTHGVNSILSYIGELFENKFEGAEGVDIFRTGSDSFAVTVLTKGKDLGKVQAMFVDILRRCIWISNTLATTGMSNEGWPAERSVQPTISFGISTSDASANGIMDNIKAGGEGRQPIKYVIVADSDLRHSLGLSIDDINRIKAQAIQGIDMASADPDELIYFESQTPVDQVRDTPGAIVVECSYGDMPKRRKQELSMYRESKNRYLKEPVGAVLLDAERGIYGPLKEAYKYPS